MRRRGLSLYEALVSIFMVLLALSILAQMFRNYSNAARTAAGKSRTLVGAQIVLDRIRNELREAVVIDAPAAVGSPATQITFHKIDPAQASTRLPSPSPAPPPANWKPSDSTYLCQVRYYLQGSTLLREAKPADGSTATSVLLEEVTEMSCTRNADNSLDVTVTVHEARLNHVLTTKIARLLP